MARTDEAVLTRQALEVTLGGEKRLVRPLVIRDSREWRKRVAEAFAELGALDAGTLNLADPEGVRKALELVAVTVPEKIADLVLAYAPELDREWFEAHVTDEEATEALVKMLEVTFPFLRRTSDLVRLTAALR
jgi:hypothetical protein